MTRVLLGRFIVIKNPNDGKLHIHHHFRGILNRRFSQKDELNIHPNWTSIGSMFHKVIKYDKSLECSGTNNDVFIHVNDIEFVVDPEEMSIWIYAVGEKGTKSKLPKLMKTCIGGFFVSDRMISNNYLRIGIYPVYDNHTHPVQMHGYHHE